jgi:ferric citrate transport system permease protein
VTASAETAGGRGPVLGRLGVLLVLGALALGGFVWSMSLGPEPIGVEALFRGTFAPTSAVSDLIVHLIRLPRALLAALAGGAFAVAGVVMQAITRNPLAAPEILGINTGAAVVVALSITIFPGIAGVSIVLLALAGAAAAAAIVFAIARFSRGGVSPVGLALAGVTLSILLFSLMQGVLVLYTEDTGSFFFWLVGGVTYANWHDIHLALPWMAGGILLALLLAERLNVLALGDDVARSLGQNVMRTRLFGSVSVVLLAGAAVGVAGPIAFIGLIVPHIVRRFVGGNHYILIPASFLFGAALLLYADIVTRYLNDHVEMPAGIVTAPIGAPFFVYLARREKVAG